MRNIFTADELLELKQRSNLRGAVLIAHCWVVIFGAMAMYVIWPNPLTFVLACAIIGGRQLGLAVLSHDCAHGLLFESLRANDIAGTWFTDYILLGDMYSYRGYHFKHHRFTQQKNDPDLGLTAPFPITPASLRRKLIRDLTGQTAYKQRLGLLKRGFGKPTDPWAVRFAHAWDWFHGAIVTNLILFAILAAAGHPYLYFTLWLLPFYTVHPAVVRVRSIAEHSMPRDNDDPMLNTRTTHANWIARIFLAPYFVNYHLEHHLLMSAPCYRLPRAHAMLLAKGYASKMEIQPGYRAVLSNAASKAIAPAISVAA